MRARNLAISLLVMVACSVALQLLALIAPALPELAFAALGFAVLWLVARSLSDRAAWLEPIAVAVLTFVFLRLLEWQQWTLIPLNWSNEEASKLSFYAVAAIPVLVAAALIMRAVLTVQPRESRDVAALAATAAVGVAWVGSYLFARLAPGNAGIMSGRMIGESFVRAVLELFPVLLVAVGVVLGLRALARMANTRIQQTPAP